MLGLLFFFFGQFLFPSSKDVKAFFPYDKNLQKNIYVPDRGSERPVSALHLKLILVLSCVIVNLVVYEFIKTTIVFLSFFIPIMIFLIIKEKINKSR
jgi:hypothetical protein